MLRHMARCSRRVARRVTRYAAVFIHTRRRFRAGRAFSLAAVFATFAVFVMPLPDALRSFAISCSPSLADFAACHDEDAYLAPDFV